MVAEEEEEEVVAAVAVAGWAAATSWAVGDLVAGLEGAGVGETSEEVGLGEADSAAAGVGRPAVQMRWRALHRGASAEGSGEEAGLGEGWVVGLGAVVVEGCKGGGEGDTGTKSRVSQALQACIQPLLTATHAHPSTIYPQHPI